MQTSNRFSAVPSAPIKGPSAFGNGIVPNAVLWNKHPSNAHFEGCRVDLPLRHSQCLQ